MSFTPESADMRVTADSALVAVLRKFAVVDDPFLQTRFQQTEPGSAEHRRLRILRPFQPNTAVNLPARPLLPQAYQAQAQAAAAPFQAASQAAAGAAAVFPKMDIPSLMSSAARVSNQSQNSQKPKKSNRGTG